MYPRGNDASAQFACCGLCFSQGTKIPNKQELGGGGLQKGLKTRAIVSTKASGLAPKLDPMHWHINSTFLSTHFGPQLLSCQLWILLRIWGQHGNMVLSSSQKTQSTKTCFSCSLTPYMELDCWATESSIFCSGGGSLRSSPAPATWKLNMLSESSLKSDTPTDADW